MVTLTLESRDIMTGISDFINEYAVGLATLSEVADHLLIAGDTFRRIKADIESLGPAPQIMREPVRLFGNGLDKLAEGAEIASRGARLDDVALIDEGTALIGEGNAFIVAASDVMTDETC